MLNLIIDIQYYNQLTSVKIGYLLTTWVESHDCIVGSGANLLRSHVLLKFSAEQLLALNWLQAQVYVVWFSPKVKYRFEDFFLHWFKVHCLKSIKNVYTYFNKGCLRNRALVFESHCLVVTQAKHCIVFCVSMTKSKSNLYWNRCIWEPHF